MARRSLVWFSATILVLAFVCDQSYAPVLRNTLSESVDLEVTYSNGRSFSGHFPPGAVIYPPAEGLEIDHVKVRPESQPPFELDKEELARLGAEVGLKDRVVWSIEKGGIRASRLGQ